MAKKQETDHVEEMKAATARASRPKETAEERNARRLAASNAALAKANAQKARADLNVLAARAGAAGMPRKFVQAIRSACDLFDLLGRWPATDVVADVTRIVAAQEQAIAGATAMFVGDEATP